jgi:hypothetical protein
MRSKQAAPLNAAQSSSFHSRPLGSVLLLLAGGAWLALALLGRSMGVMPVTIVIAMPSFKKDDDRHLLQTNHPTMFASNHFCLSCFNEQRVLLLHK